MIPDEVVERVREAADIVQIIGEYVQLKRAGTDFRGPCPFHQGTHRNFSVSPSRNMYYCFVCHEGGDVFSFLTKRLGMEWPEAVRSVASRSGITIPETTSRREGPDPREPAWEINSTAAEYFTRVLWEEDIGGEARAYLAQRNIGRATADKFSLGFAPREIGLLRDHMGALGFDENRLLEAGLLTRRDEASLPRPRFSGRLIFPIFDISGHCVGFGGRVIGSGEPKYLNSPDSAVFGKGKLLYGLNWGKGSIRRERRAILVEGYFDVIRLVEAGIENVVAPLGTALTQEQGSLLARYAREVILLYDSDSAGLKATFRAGDVLLALGVSTQVASLPSGDDPDTFVASHGVAGFNQLIGGVVDVFERKVKVLEQRGLFRDISKRRRALDHLLPTIRLTRDPLMRDLYISRVSEASGVRRDTLLKEVGSAAAPDIDNSPPSAAASNTQRTGVNDDTPVVPSERKLRRRGSVPAESAERSILAALLQRPADLSRLAERIGADDFWVPGHRSIYEAVLGAGEEATVADVAAKLPSDLIQELQDILDYGESLADLRRTVDDSMTKLEIRGIEREKEVLLRQIPVAASEEEAQSLLRERQLLDDRLRQLGGRSWKTSTTKKH